MGLASAHKQVIILNYRYTGEQVDNKHNQKLVSGAGTTVH